MCGAALCYGLLSSPSSAHADAVPAYACVTVNLADDGTLTGSHCKATNGAPATGPITQPFAVWSALQLTRFVWCTTGQADTPANITASGCVVIL
ncbi:hypothetical protein [Nonomuraea africana]|uniref:Secreted protein n=1 Tax=Nonomuraea africana TaxID=46171 RepID=A0ABR9KVF0_9ACTN|nr:hypothetical protein [Nonomuraea africana]MBE1565994.1 hypothetical protein [Nonomuraea africana]